MLIRSRMGVSADGFVGTPDGVPALALMPGFVPGVRADRVFPDGSAELSYAPGEPGRGR
jgi:hypothetical protein